MIVFSPTLIGKKSFLLVPRLGAMSRAKTAAFGVVGGGQVVPNTDDITLCAIDDEFVNSFDNHMPSSFRLAGRLLSVQLRSTRDPSSYIAEAQALRNVSIGLEHLSIVSQNLQDAFLTLREDAMAVTDPPPLTQDQYCQLLAATFWLAYHRLVTDVSSERRFKCMRIRQCFACLGWTIQLRDVGKARVLDLPKNYFDLIACK